MADSNRRQDKSHVGENQEMYFSTKTLVKKMKRKFKKDFSMTFLSKESP